MSDFTLTLEHRHAIIAQRIQALNEQGYTAELDRATAEAVGNLEGVQQATATIEAVKKALAVHENELKVD